LALKVNSRKIIGYAVGDRSVNTFKRLWDGISDKIKHKAISYTDLGCLQFNPLQAKNHKKKYNHIEQLFLTLRNDNPKLEKQSDSLNLSKCSKFHSNCRSTTIIHQQYHGITSSWLVLSLLWVLEKRRSYKGWLSCDLVWSLNYLSAIEKGYWINKTPIIKTPKQIPILDISTPKIAHIGEDVKITVYSNCYMVDNKCMHIFIQSNFRCVNNNRKRWNSC